MVNEEKLREPIFKDIRRYYCEFCGICRSKKSLIASHILSEHQDEVKEEEPEKKSNTCEDCGVSFLKPAHLKQHIEGHSLERTYICPVDDCKSNYKRKDHLNRHMLKHQGKLFKCPVEFCKSRFAFQANMKRHINELHDDSVSERVEPRPKGHVCPEAGCGKVFKYPSQLQKHENSHVKLQTVEALCVEPGCMKYFSNEQCLKEHVRSCHQHTICDKCGTKQLRKNMKRHMRMHEAEVSSERVKCTFDGCSLTFSTKSNLDQHIKAVHMALKPFACSFPNCQMKFAFKHVRDNHEKSGSHVYILGDFEEADELFHSRPRGGIKRNYPVIETLTRKRVVPPSDSELFNIGLDN